MCCSLCARAKKPESVGALIELRPLRWKPPALSSFLERADVFPEVPASFPTTVFESFLCSKMTVHPSEALHHGMRMFSKMKSLEQLLTSSKK